MGSISDLSITKFTIYQKSVGGRPYGAADEGAEDGDVEPVGVVVREGLRPPPRDQREQPRGEVSGGVDGVPGVESEAAG